MQCAGPRLKVTAALHAKLFYDVRFYLVSGRRRQRQDRRPGERARLVGIATPCFESPYATLCYYALHAFLVVNPCDHLKGPP